MIRPIPYQPFNHPKFDRGKVWCIKCGRVDTIDCYHALSCGWPKCCGETMTIDSPEERMAIKKGEQA